MSMTRAAAWRQAFVPCVLALAASQACTAYAAPQKLLYASPTAQGSGDCLTAANSCTLINARTQARLLRNLNADVVVNLQGGDYFLSSTFTLDNNDSGLNGYDVIYQAASATSPPVFHGGRKIPDDAWTRFGSLWGVSLQNLFPGETFNFRQLYVNGQRATRARYPNANAATPYLNATGASPVTVTNDAAHVSSASVTTSGSVKTFTHGNVELVWLAHYKQPRARLQGYTVSGDTASFIFQPAEQGNSHLLGINQPTTPYYLENDIAFLDQDGEWFYDNSSGTQSLFYKSPASAPPLNAVIPLLETPLVSIEGNSATSPVTHLQLKGIHFAYTNWLRPSTLGYISDQGGWSTRASTGPDYQPMTSAVRVSNASRVRLEGNTFRAIGATALYMTNQLQDVEVDGNTFTDIAGSGIVQHSDTPGYSNARSVITNNLVDGFGRDYADAVGILVTHAQDLKVEFNEVAHGSYSGVSTGWKWNTGSFGFDRNLVRFNHVHHVMTQLDDGGAIYTLGRSNNGFIQENHLASISRSPFAGLSPIAAIYLDNGSVGKTVSHNAVSSANAAFFAQAGGIADGTDTRTFGNVFTVNFYNGPIGLINNQSFPDSTPPNVFTGQGNQDKTGIDLALDVDAAPIVAGAGRATNHAPKLRPGLNTMHTVVTSSKPGTSGNAAVDGLIDDNGWEPTSIDSSPYWWLDLGTSDRIRKIEIVGRAGPPVASERSNLEVWAAATLDVGAEIKIAPLSGTSFPDAGSARWTIVLPASPPYIQNFRFLKIKKTAAESFYLREVKVYRGLEP